MLAEPILMPEIPGPHAAQPTAPTRADAAPAESERLFQGRRMVAISGLSLYFFIKAL